MNPQPIRIAVVGAGRLGTFHARLARQNDSLQLVAVADPSPDAATRLAAETGAEAVADPHALAGRIDAAVVAAPTVAHHAITKPLLAAGVHTLVEKPLTTTAAEAEDLIETAQRTGAVLQAGHVERFNPAIAAAGGSLRNPKFIQARRTSGYTFRSTDIGAVLDLMIHDIDLTLALAGGDVTGVSAIGASVLGDHEDLATAQLTFANGCVAQLTASRVSYQAERSMQVFTTRGFTSLDFATGQATIVSPREDVLRRSFHVASLSDDAREDLRANLFDKLLVKETVGAPAVNAIDEEQRDFIDAIRTGRSPRVPGAAGRDAVAVANQIIERIHEHAWDGDAASRSGMFPTPALPIVPAAHHWPADRPPARRAG